MTFAEFWPHYLSLHGNPTNRALHMGGTAAALALLAFAAWRGKLWPVPVALAAGYGAAWTGHFLFEKNRPATFSHPLLSLRADLRLLARHLTLGAQHGRPR